MFTEASTSLETAFRELQARAQRLSEELEAKNKELQRSLGEKAEVQNYLETILRNLPCGVLVLDGAGEVALCNRAGADILQGGTRVRRGKARQQVRLGSPVLREYLATSVSEGGALREIEIPFLCGDRMRVLSTTGTPLRSTGGERIGTLHIIRDVTEWKALEEQGKRRERLSAMGEMAVELAHEIRNPLGSIELFASLLEKELPEGGDAARWAENIRVGSRSLNNIVSNMLHFANPLEPVIAELDVHDVIREVLGFSEPITQQRGVEVISRLEAQLPVISGDRELIKQVMLNLILNALQAMPSRGSLSISTRDAESGTGADPGRHIEIRVQDTGIGIAPENLGRVFDPFFTTNKRGTGLGLSVVHRIVERHSGSIRVESRPGIGTTFSVVLPCVEALTGDAPKGAPDA
jgi:signal transduction histidine kinase